MTKRSTVIQDCLERLDWIRDEYGEDDIDYTTFSPAIALLIAATESAPVPAQPKTGALTSS